MPGVGCGNRKQIPGNILNMKHTRNTNSVPARHIAAKRLRQNKLKSKAMRKLTYVLSVLILGLFLSTPQPETIIRVMMLARPLTNKIDVPLQDLKPFHKTRKGFTVVERGGSVIHHSDIQQ